MNFSQDFIAIAEERDRLRQELSLAEEALANYEEEVQVRIKVMVQKDMEIAQLSRELHRIREESLTWAMACPHDCPACDAMYEAIKGLADNGLGES